MKKLINITTAPDDLSRYKDRESFLDAISGLDGIELAYYGDNSKNIIPKDAIIGYHMTMPNYWYDFYKGYKDILLSEFDSEDKWIKYYGDSDPKILLIKIKEELNRAINFGAEYVVFHASDCSFTESITFNYRHSDEEIIDGIIEIINDVFDDKNLSIKLLLENLWVPGMNFRAPKSTERLLSGINYKHKGIMLDTGHLMHTNTSLKSQEEAVSYINDVLNQHGKLCEYIKGIHLNKSLSGEFIKKLIANSPGFKETFEERHWQTFEHIFKIDLHQPFTAKGVNQLINRINPDYLTMEFITSTLKQQNAYKEEQLNYLMSEGSSGSLSQ